MEIQPNGMMSVLFYSTEPAWERIPCTVQIRDGRISVEYKEKDDSPASYEGFEDGEGHFHLEATAAHISGTATLHKSPAKPRILEGNWKESRNGRSTERGMWIITLNEPSEW